MLAVVAATGSASAAPWRTAPSTATASQGGPPITKAYYRNCGDGLPRHNYFDLKAHRIRCRLAHHFADHHFVTGDKHFDGWSCHDHLVGEAGTSRCHRRFHGRFEKFKYAFGV